MLNRLIEPASENELPNWIETTALGDLLGFPTEGWAEHSLKLSGYKSTWRTLRRKLDTHCYVTLIIPDADGFEHHIRKPGRPNPIQKLIYTLLGIDWTELPVKRRTHKKG